MTPRLLRAAAAAFADWLRNAHLATAQSQPGRLLQAKRIFASDTAVPDGLSPAYLARAAQANAESRAAPTDLPALLLCEIEAELGRVVVLEAQILAGIGHGP